MKPHVLDLAAFSGLAQERHRRRENSIRKIGLGLLSHAPAISGAPRDAAAEQDIVNHPTLRRGIRSLAAPSSSAVELPASASPLRAPRSDDAAHISSAMNTPPSSVRDATARSRARRPDDRQGCSQHFARRGQRLTTRLPVASPPGGRIRETTFRTVRRIARFSPCAAAPIEFSVSACHGCTNRAPPLQLLSRAGAVRHHDAEKRRFLEPRPPQTILTCHLSSCFLSAVGYLINDFISQARRASCSTLHPADRFSFSSSGRIASAVDSLPRDVRSPSRWLSAGSR